MLIPTLCDWCSSSASACDFHFIVSDRVVSGIRTLFSLEGKVPGSDSDSVASENQPIERKAYIRIQVWEKPKYPIPH